jgi:hypothetical protein
MGALQWLVTDIGAQSMNPHRVDPIVLNGITKYGIFVSFSGEDYIFRYAYDEHDKAVEVAQNLNHGNSNCDDATTIAYNYWMYPNNKYKFTFARMTTQKSNWHIIRSELQ